MFLKAPRISSQMPGMNIRAPTPRVFPCGELTELYQRAMAPTRCSRCLWWRRDSPMPRCCPIHRPASFSSKRQCSVSHSQHALLLRTRRRLNDSHSIPRGKSQRGEKFCYKDSASQAEGKVHLHHNAEFYARGEWWGNHGRSRLGYA